jgi:predicted nucleic acid-binding protein
MRIFIDSDVVISSLISQSGAAYALLHLSTVSPVISSHSHDELKIVIDRLDIDPTLLENLLSKRCELHTLSEQLSVVRQQYELFVTDANDAHIVAGAHLAGVQFLITYNIKHYKLEKIKNELDIVVLSPARFLQFLRSQ